MKKMLTELTDGVVERSCNLSGKKQLSMARCILGMRYCEVAYDNTIREFLTKKNKKRQMVTFNVFA